MTKTKILFIITKSNFGGAQKNLFELAASLPKENFEISAVVGGKGELFERLTKENIGVYPLLDLKRNISIGGDIRSAIKIFKLIKKINPDIVHLHSPKAAGLGALASRLLGVKKIAYTVHGGTWNEDRSSIQKKLIKSVSWLTMLLCHKVILLSQKEFLQISKWSFSKKLLKKLVVIPIGIKTIEMLPKDNARAELETLSVRRGLAEEDFLIGSIGELHKNKGYKYALQALASLPFSFKYFIVGEGEERKNLEQIIKEKNLQNKVFLTGNVPEASKLLKAFDLFLLPSIKEGLPYVILEAGLAGIPIISTNVGGIPEIIENSKTGVLVNPKNPLEIKEAILKVKNSQEEAEKMAEILQKKVADDFSLEKMVIHTLKVYSSKTI